ALKGGWYATMRIDFRPVALVVTIGALRLASPVAPAHAQSAAAVAVDIRQHVEALTADDLEGRLAGSPGEALAADYIVEQLQAIGAQPLPGQTDYRLPFEFTAGTRDGGSSVLTGDRTFEGTG